jgi:hypothetical protein
LPEYKEEQVIRGTMARPINFAGYTTLKDPLKNENKPEMKR